LRAARMAPEERDGGDEETEDGDVGVSVVDAVE
jgi:hypothetical protein